MFSFYGDILNVLDTVSSPTIYGDILTVLDTVSSFCETLASPSFYGYWQIIL